VNVKIATVNSFFDGVSVNDLSASKWLSLHLKVFLGNQSLLRSYQIKRKETHPVRFICETYNPDIIVVNEVIESSEKNETIQFLKNRGYQGVDLDAAVEVTAEFKRGTLVASRYPSETVQIEVQRFPGGRFSALKIEKLNLIVIGVQGTPFNWLIRKYQIRAILSYLDKFDSEGYKVVVAGDFNMGIRNSSLSLPENMGHYTERSFPSPGFYEKICNDKSFAANLMCGLLKVREAPRSLDHILFNKGEMNLVSSMPCETISDHCALIATFETAEDSKLSC
jgi:endonuclease/exonuclease/phosphatase family metal-dependent hydrolase